MKKLLILLFAVAPMMAQANAELESRIEALEERSMLNIFDFSGNLKYSYDSRDIKTDAGTETQGNWNRLTFGLNINAKPYENLSFFSTLRMSKYFNTIFGGVEPASGLTASRDMGGSMMFVEKAYADYSFSDKFVFSFGRLPTIDGVPANYMYGKPVMGTYPSMAYASTLDGLAFTYKAMDSLAIRAVYSPLGGAPFTVSKSDEAANDDDIPSYSFRNDTNQAEVATIMLDYNKQFSWTSNFNAIVQHIMIPKYDTIKSQTGTASSSSAGLLSEYSFTTIHFEMLNLMNSGVHVSLSNLQTTGKVEGEGALAAQSADNSGSGTLLSLAYGGINNAIIGFDYITSDDEYMKYDTAHEFLGNVTGSAGNEAFTSTVGTGMNLYYTHKFEPTFTATLGYMTQDISAVNWGTYGAKTPATANSDMKEIKTAYLRLNLDF